VGEQDPIVRQTVLEGTSFLTLGTPLMLGSVDIPGKHAAHGCRCGDGAGCAVTPVRRPR
jgi:hypothetical protein